MLPKTLALIDDDIEYTEFLSQHLREQGVEVSVFPDSNDLLTDEDAYGFGFYVVDLMLPGVNGLELIKLIRRRSEVGLLVVSGQLAPDVFNQIVSAGADMYLAKPVLFEQVISSIKAVQRRVQPAQSADVPWTLDRRARQLVAPDGAAVDLSDIDMAVMGCLERANGMAVTRETLCHALGRTPDGTATDGLNAIMFRLRRRIERATSLTAPLQSKPRVGYLFKAPLKII
jgi:two-component system, OmpR family, response regulator